MSLQPKDLTKEVLQGLLDTYTPRAEIMETYNLVSVSYYYDLRKKLGCRSPIGRSSIKHDSGGPTTAEEKLMIDKLYAEGKTLIEIRDIMGITYSQIYRRVMRDKIKNYDANSKSDRKSPHAKPKPKQYESQSILNTTSADKFVPTDKEMPPTYKSELKIIVDKELAELACTQMGLPEPVATLAERPVSYSASGWVRAGNK